MTIEQRKAFRIIDALTEALAAKTEDAAQTEGFPRLIVTSAQDAVDQLRRMAG